MFVHRHRRDVLSLNLSQPVCAWVQLARCFRSTLKVLLCCCFSAAFWLNRNFKHCRSKVGEWWIHWCFFNCHTMKIKWKCSKTTNALLCWSSNGKQESETEHLQSQKAPHLHHHNALLGEACCDLPRWSDIVALSSYKGLLHDWVSADNPWQECGGVAPWLTNCCRRAEGWFRISWKHCVGLQKKTDECSRVGLGLCGNESKWKNRRSWIWQESGRLWFSLWFGFTDGLVTLTTRWLHCIPLSWNFTVSSLSDKQGLGKSGRTVFRRVHVDFVPFPHIEGFVCL